VLAVVIKAIRMNDVPATCAFAVMLGGIIGYLDKLNWMNWIPGIITKRS